MDGVVGFTASRRLPSGGELAKQRGMSAMLYSRAAPLLEAEIDDEIVALDREQGEVFGFNLVASDVWRLLEQPLSLGDLCAQLEQRYEVEPEQCAREITELLDQLVEMKLVKRIPAA